MKNNNLFNKIMIIVFFLLAMLNSATCQNISKTITNNQNIKLDACYFDDCFGFTNYPHIMKSLAYEYNEIEPIWGWITSTPEIVKAQIDVAADAGIDFFSFCWYFSENTNISTPLNRALNFYLDSKNSHKMEFNIMVANQQDIFAIGPKNWEKITDIWITLMIHPQYLHLEEKPLITFSHTQT